MQPSGLALGFLNVPLCFIVGNSDISLLSHYRDVAQAIKSEVVT